VGTKFKEWVIKKRECAPKSRIENIGMIAAVMVRIDTRRRAEKSTN
jgi:hypothetical protein